MTGRQTPRFQLIPGDKGLAAGDARTELRDLYERYGASVFGRCAYVLRDRSKAEDAMQDVFAKALTHYGSFRAEASPLTWLIKIATHHCLTSCAPNGPVGTRASSVKPKHARRARADRRFSRCAT